MKTKTRNLLKEAQQYCDDEERSTEFMLQYMQDFAGVDLDCVLNYLESNQKEDEGEPDAWSGGFADNH